MYIREIHLDDRTEAIGTCEGDRAFRVYSAAAKLLTDKGLIDQSVGEIAVCVCGNFITLPPEVGTILGVQVDSSPTLIRDSWFTWHLNGPGDQGWTPCGMADVIGTDFCTIRDVDRPVKLAARIYKPADANKKVRFHGYDEPGKVIHTLGADGRMAPGFFVPTLYGSSAANANAAAIVKFTGVWKERTADFIDILAIDPDTNEAISLIARYGPDETSPRYTRIRVSANNVVRVKFRRRDMAVRSENDWINVDDPEAFLLACKAVVKRRAGQYAEADACEMTAARMIKQAQDRRMHGGIAPSQCVIDAAGLSPGSDSMFY